MATALGEASSTIMGWKRRNCIPKWRRDAVIEAARKRGIELGDSLLAATAPTVADKPISQKASLSSAAI